MRRSRLPEGGLDGSPEKMSGPNALEYLHSSRATREQAMMDRVGGPVVLSHSSPRKQRKQQSRQPADENNNHILPSPSRPLTMAQLDTTPLGAIQKWAETSQGGFGRDGQEKVVVVAPAGRRGGEENSAADALARKVDDLEVSEARLEIENARHCTRIKQLMASVTELEAERENMRAEFAKDLGSIKAEGDARIARALEMSAAALRTKDEVIASERQAAEGLIAEVREEADLAAEREADAKEAKAESDRKLDDALIEIQALNSEVSRAKSDLQSLLASHTDKMDRLRSEHAAEIRRIRDQIEQKGAHEKAKVVGELEAMREHESMVATGLMEEMGQTHIRDIEDASERIIQLSSGLDDAKAIIEEVSCERDVLHQRVVALEVALRQETETREHFQAMLEETKDAKVSLEDAFRATEAGLRAELVQSRDDYEKRIVDLEEQRKAVVSVNEASLEASCSEWSAKVKGLEALVKSENGRADEATALAVKREAERDAAIKERDETHRREEIAQEEIEAALCERDEIEKERDAAVSERDAARRACSELQAENAGLRGEVDALRELTAVLTRELDESQRECEDVRGELQGAAMREAECRRLLEERMEEHREAAEEYAMLCQEEMERKEQQMEAVLHQSFEKIVETRREHDQAEQQVSALKEKILEGGAGDLSNVGELEEELVEMSMRIVELEEERGSMAERAARAERQLSRSKEEEERRADVLLKEMCSDLESKVTALTRENAALIAAAQASAARSTSKSPEKQQVFAARERETVAAAAQEILTRTTRARETTVMDRSMLIEVVSGIRESREELAAARVDWAGLARGHAEAHDLRNRLEASEAALKSLEEDVANSRRGGGGGRSEAHLRASQASERARSEREEAIRLRAEAAEARDQLHVEARNLLQEVNRELVGCLGTSLRTLAGVKDVCIGGGELDEVCGVGIDLREGDRAERCALVSGFQAGWGGIAGWGLGPGDEITEVDGKQVTGLGAATVEMMLQGDFGTRTEITARRAEGGEVVSVSAVRGKPGWLGGRGIERIQRDAVDAIMSERREGEAVLGDAMERLEESQVELSRYGSRLEASAISERDAKRRKDEALDKAAETDGLKETLITCQAQLDCAVADRDSAKGREEQLKVAKEGLEGRITALYGEVDALSEKLAEEEGKVCSLARERDAADSALKAASADVERLRGERDAAEGKAAHAEDELRLVSGRVGGALGQCSAVEGELVDTRARLREVEKALDEAQNVLRREVEMWEGRAEGWERKRGELEAKAGRCEEDFELVRAKLSVAESSLEAAGSERDEAVERANRLESEADASRGEWDAKLSKLLGEWEAKLSEAAREGDAKVASAISEGDAKLSASRREWEAALRDVTSDRDACQERERGHEVGAVRAKAELEAAQKLLASVQAQSEASLKDLRAEMERMGSQVDACSAREKEAKEGEKGRATECEKLRAERESAVNESIHAWEEVMRLSALTEEFRQTVEGLRGDVRDGEGKIKAVEDEGRESARELEVALGERDGALKRLKVLTGQKGSTAKELDDALADLEEAKEEAAAAKRERREAQQALRAAQKEVERARMAQSDAEEASKTAREGSEGANARYGAVMTELRKVTAERDGLLISVESASVELRDAVLRRDEAIDSLGKFERKLAEKRGRKEEKLENEVVSLRQELESAVAVCQENAEALTKANLELSRLEGSQEASSEAHNLLKEENARLRTLLEEGEAQLGVLRSDVAALQQKVEKLQAEKTMIEGQFKSVVTERDQALAEVAGLRGEATALAHDRAVAHGDVQGLLMELKKIGEERDAAEELVKQSAAELEESLQKIQMLEGTLERAQDEGAHLRGELRDLNERREGKEVEIVELEGQVESLRLEADEHREKASVSERFLDEVRADFHLLEAAARTEVDNGALVREELEKAREEIQVMRVDVEEARGRARVLEERQGSLFDESAEAEGRSRGLEDEVRGLRDRAGELKGENTVLTQRVSELKDEAMSLKFRVDELSPLLGENVSLREAVDRVEGEKQSLKGDMESLEGEKHSLTEEVQVLHEDVTGHCQARGKDAEKWEEEKERLNEDIEKLREEKVRLTDAVEEGGKEREKLSAQVALLQERIAQMEEKEGQGNETGHGGVHGVGVAGESEGDGGQEMGKESLRGEVGRLEDELGSSKEEVMRLRGLLEDAERKRGIVQADMGILRQSITKLESEKTMMEGHEGEGKNGEDGKGGGRAFDEEVLRLEEELAFERERLGEALEGAEGALARCEVAEGESEELRARISRMEEDARRRKEEFDQEVSRLQSAVEEAQEDEAAKKFMKEAAELRRAALEENSRLLAEVDDLSSTLAKVSRELSECTSQKDALLKQRDALKNSLSLVNSVPPPPDEGLVSSLREKDGIIISLTRERDALSSEKDALSSERDALLSQWDALRGERDALLLQIPREKTASEEEPTDPTLLLDELRGERDALVTERATLLQQWDDSCREREALQKELEGLRRERDALPAAKFDQGGPDSGGMEADLRRERDALLKRRDQLMLSLKDAESRSEALAKRVEELEAGQASAESQLSDARTESQRMRTELAELAKTGGNMMREAGKVQAREAQLTQEVVSLEAQILMLRGQEERAAEAEGAVAVANDAREAAEARAARAEERLGQVVAGLGRKAWGIEQDGGSAGPKPPTESMNGSGRQHVMSLIEEMGEAEASDKVMGLIEEIVGAIEEALQGALLEARQNEDAVEGTEEVVCEFLRIQSNEGSFHAQQDGEAPRLSLPPPGSHIESDEEFGYGQKRKSMHESVRELKARLFEANFLLRERDLEIAKLKGESEATLKHKGGGAVLLSARGKGKPAWPSAGSGGGGAAGGVAGLFDMAMSNFVGAVGEVGEAAGAAIGLGNEHGKSKEGDERLLVSKAQDEVLEIGAELARCRKQLEEAQGRLRELEGSQKRDGVAQEERLAALSKQLEEAQERLRLSEEAQGKMKELEEAQERVKQLNSHLEDAKGVQQKMLRREADLLDEVEKLRGAAQSGATDAGNPDKVWCESCQILKEEVRGAKEVVEREAGRAQSLQGQLSDAQADLRRMRSEVEMQAGRAQALVVELERERSSNKGQGAQGTPASANDGSGECQECAGLRVELACALDRLDEAEAEAEELRGKCSESDALRAKLEKESGRRAGGSKNEGRGAGGGREGGEGGGGPLGFLGIGR